jgi:hypothetical protein
MGKLKQLLLEQVETHPDDSRLQPYWDCQVQAEPDYPEAGDSTTGTRTPPFSLKRYSDEDVLRTARCRRQPLYPHGTAANPSDRRPLIMGEGDKVLFRIQLSKEEFLELCDLRYRLIFEPEITAPILSLVRQDAA